MGAPRARRRRNTRTPVVLSNFRGWNDDNNNAALHDFDLRTAQNILFERRQLIGSRYGYYRDPFAAAIGGGNPITGIIDWQPDRDAAPRPIFVAGTAINEDDGDGTPTARTGTATITAGRNNLFTFGIMQASLYGTNGVDVPFELGSTGNAAALSGWYANNRKAKYFHSQFGYLFAAGFTGTGDTGSSEGAAQHPMGVQYSELQDANTWLEANVIDKIGGFASFGDEYVTGLFRHRDFLMIGTNRRIYPVSYEGTTWGRFPIQRPLEVGLAHQRAVVSINGEFTFFMSPNGHVHTIRQIAATFGDVAVSQALTSKVSNYIDNLNRQRIVYSHGTFMEEPGWVVFAVSQGVNQANHNELLILDVSDFQFDDPDPRQAKWIRWTNVQANSMAVLKRSTKAASQSTPLLDGYEHLVFGNDTGWAKRFTDTISYDEQDDGTQDAISTVAATKYFDFAFPLDQKSVVEAYFDMEPSTTDPGPTAMIEYDYGTVSSNSVQINMTGNIGESFNLGPDPNPFILDSSTLASTQNITRDRARFLNGGGNASLKLSQSVKDTEQWRMQQATLLVDIRGVSPDRPEA